MTQSADFSNHLVGESSPYLQQHAHNPVDWYPWGQEALEKARGLDRPIFLSVGYSACHWCHVMEHESFEDPEVARLLNELFVSIKVDREERPDVDQIYMNAVQMLTGQGGWPMSVFLTPDLKPFFGGTYFPPDDRYGRPSFKKVVRALADAWRERRDEIESSSQEITHHLQEVGRLEPVDGELGAELLRRAVGVLGRAFDPTYGGFGPAPKFPHAMDLRLLLRAAKRFRDDDALAMARRTLDHMAMGGIYDQLGGGFHRYSTDARWLVPHFEKMLYDNALLSPAYLEAFQVTGDTLYRDVVLGTLDHVLRDLTGPEGGFYSALDADSEGVEGKYYVWSAEEFEGVLGKELADVAGDVYSVTAEGNWEGHNILSRSKTFSQQARLRGMPEAELREKLEIARQKLLARRQERVRPARDEKVLTSWNGLMIAALAQAAPVLDKPDYALAAGRAADFILTHMRAADGRLLRTYRTGAGAKLNAYLEDYAFLIDALVSLYEATFAKRWLAQALELTQILIEQFWDAEQSGFYYTGKDHEELIARSRDSHDGSLPSGNSVAVLALLRLAKLTGRPDLRDKAEATLRLYRGILSKAPTAAGQMLIALDFFLGPVHELAIVGDPTSPQTKRVLAAVYGKFLPNRVLALKDTRQPDSEIAALVPLLAGKEAKEDVTTYVCRDFVCQEPLVGAEAAEEALRKLVTVAAVSV